MSTSVTKQLRTILSVIGFLTWLSINIRVEAGIGSPFERALDGLVGGLVLLFSLFLGLRFFGFLEIDRRREGKSRE